MLLRLLAGILRNVQSAWTISAIQPLHVVLLAHITAPLTEHACRWVLVSRSTALQTEICLARTHCDGGHVDKNPAC